MIASMTNQAWRRQAGRALIVAAAAAAGALASAVPAAVVALEASPPPIVPADLAAVRAAAQAPGAAAVLVNVWASWCEPCRAEMPRLLAFHRAHRAAGLRLVLVSADDPHDKDKAAAFLGSLGVDFPSWLKQGDDGAFIDGLDRRWTGALPASFFYDGAGKLRRLWQGEVETAELEAAWAEATAAGSAKAKPKAKAKARSKTDAPGETERKP